jgi:hypothetical protein
MPKIEWRYIGLLAAASLMCGCGNSATNQEGAMSGTYTSREADQFRLEVYDVARANLRNVRAEIPRSSPHEALGSPREVRQTDGYYLASLLAYLRERGIVENYPRRHRAMLTELEEIYGGGWEVVEPTTELVDALEPRRFKSDTMRDYYNADGSLTDQDAGQKMLTELKLVRESVSQAPLGSIVLLRIGLGR